MKGLGKSQASTGLLFRNLNQVAIIWVDSQEWVFLIVVP